MNSPTIIRRRRSATDSQQAASPAANSPLRVGLSPVGFVRTPPMV
jgi:hypothetical protein